MRTKTASRSIFSGSVCSDTICILKGSPFKAAKYALFLANTYCIIDYRNQGCEKEKKVHGRGI